MRIAVCDDNQEDINIIVKELRRIDNIINFNLVLYQFMDDNTMVSDIIKNNIEVVLLDIDMPEVTGIDIANRLTKYAPFINIIFLTNRADLVFQAIRCRPLRFVRKNYMWDELEEAILAAQEKITTEMHLIHIRNDCVKSSYAIKDMVYIESNGHYVEIHTQNKVKKIRGKISDYEKKLEDYGFIRIHVGYLVNLRYITNITKKQVFLDNGETLPISRNHVKDIQIKFARGLEKVVYGSYI